MNYLHTMIGDPRMVVCCEVAIPAIWLVVIHFGDAKRRYDTAQRANWTAAKFAAEQQHHQAYQRMDLSPLFEPADERLPAPEMPETDLKFIKQLDEAVGRAIAKYRLEAFVQK
ncbi:MAG: hypothetical protein WBE76_21615 [Terracidiphilus sp.]